MVRMVLMLATWAVAFSWGYGWLSWPWLALCFLFGYMRGVLFMGERVPGGNFQGLPDEEFRKTSKVVWWSTLMSLLPIAIWGGIGKLVSLAVN